ECLQGLQLHGLGEVGVEARVEGPLAVLGLAVAGQGDEQHALPQAGPHLRGHRVAVQPRQPDVDQGYLRAEGQRRFDSLPPVFHQVHAVAEKPQQQGQALPPVPVVLADQNVAAGGGRARGGAGPAAAGPAAPAAPAAGGSRTVNSLPWPRPGLLAVIVPPCISTSRLTSVSPIPSPPWGRSGPASICVNNSKMWGSI